MTRNGHFPRPAETDPYVCACSFTIAEVFLSFLGQKECLETGGLIQHQKAASKLSTKQFTPVPAILSKAKLLSAKFPPPQSG